MTDPDYRTAVLERLCQRDRFVGQFSRLIDSYASISESLNVVLSSDKRRKYDSSPAVAGDDSKEIQRLKDELSELYKKRSTNDQHLIDAQKKIVDLEARLAAVLETKGELEHQLKELKEQLRQKELVIHEIEQEKQVMGDEVIALHALNNSLNKKFLEADQERVQILNHLKQMKDREVHLLNEFNEKEQQIRLQRLKLEIDEAIKPTSSKDILERKPSTASSVGSNISVFDELPSRCFFSTECDEIGEVNDCCFNKTGKMFFTAGNDKIVRIYQLNGERANLMGKLTGFSSAVNRLHVHNDSPLILAASNDKTVRVYSIDDQRLKCVLTGHDNKVSSARFLSNANKIVSGSLDRTIKVWDAFSVRCIKTFFVGSTVTDVAVSDTSQIFISSHFDQQVRFWDSRTKDPIATIKLDGKITSICLSTDQNKLLCCCRDETLSLFDVRIRHTEHIYSADSYRTSYDFCKCLISPSMNYVLAGSAEGQIFIWNMQSTKLEKVLSRGGHEGAQVYSLAYHPTERILLSTDRRKKCCLWD